MGVYLRLDQLQFQVLLDDEWHVIHQILQGKGPTELLRTFGTADYSIPLGLLYWFQSHWFGLSELNMRWPMLFFGVASLFAFTGYAWRKVSPYAALVLAVFLSVSPMLVIYSRTARPYALTLLLSYIALYAFYRYWQNGSHRFNWAVVYCILAPLCIWLHPITGPFVITPFLLETARSLLQSRWRDLSKLAMLAIPAGLVTALLIIPPISNDPGALLEKSGMAHIDTATIIGMWYMWLGTPSTICIILLVALSGFGIGPLLRKSELLQSAALGLVLTATLVLLTQPAWANNSLTFGRYLLPAIPLLLLCLASGVVRLALQARKHFGITGQTLVALTLLILMIGYGYHSPLWGLLHVPNSHTTHSRFQIDFRSSRNMVVQYQDTIPLSPFWASLSASPANSLLVAVAPFHFETYNWDAVRWEQLGEQRIQPAYFTGFCTQFRYGEVPQNQRFQFKNAFYLSSLGESQVSKPDWLVYTKVPQAKRNDRLVGNEIWKCVEKLRRERGIPDYEDEYLFAYRLKP